MNLNDLSIFHQEYFGDQIVAPLLLQEDPSGDYMR